MQRTGVQEKKKKRLVNTMDRHTDSIMMGALWRVWVYEGESGPFCYVSEEGGVSCNQIVSYFMEVEGERASYIVGGGWIGLFWFWFWFSFSSF